MGRSPALVRPSKPWPYHAEDDSECCVSLTEAGPPFVVGS